MLDDRNTASRRLAEFAVPGVILAMAAVARLWNLGAGVPHAVGIDEPQVVDRALRILRTGDWNPHIFDYPTLVIYFNALVAIVRFMWGALKGEWGSLDAFSIAAVYMTGRVAAALIGVATVWLTYCLGRELSSRRVALLAAAQLAVRPIHVRESRFILTDVPMAALTTLTVWLAVRAGRLGTVRAYAWAGIACGLAAAAKYNGGIAIVAPIAAWLLHERASPDRFRKLGAIVGGAGLAFLAGAPYTLLDMPAFLDGFAAQFSRFAAPLNGTDPAWLLYIKHLSLAGSYWVPIAAAGMAILIWRGSARVRWAPVIVFTVVYFYMLSSHSHVFGRYAVPLLPMLCLFSSVAVMEVLRGLDRIPALARPAPRRLFVAAVWVALLFGPIRGTVRWLDLQKRADTRQLAADWLKTSTPKGTRIAVENSGPTYLSEAGFKVAGTERLIDHSADWYRQRVDYLVISTFDLTKYGEYVNAGPTVFQISPTLQRFGPPIQIVRIKGS
jgi:4-amino-4-deoxy-L-arabinose transferase-like glycosyltransferase